MNSLFFDLWGSSPGLNCLAAPTRVFLGFCVTIGLFLIDPVSAKAVFWIVGTLVVWLLILRPRLRLIFGIAFWTVLLGSSFFLLAALAGLFGGSVIGIEEVSPKMGLASSLKIVFKGFVTTVLALTTLSSLDPAQLHEALVRLRVPRTLVGLITQILIQSGVLLEETLSLIRAVRLRYSQSGIRVLWLLTCGIPSMWLPRVLNRAERTAAAMVWRGFDGRLSLAEVDPLGAHDWIVVLAATGWLSVSLLFFRWGVP